MFTVLKIIDGTHCSEQQSNNVEYTRYDLNSIPLGFMRSVDCRSRLNETILQLENSSMLQTDVNTMYSSFVNIEKSEMDDKLNTKHIRLRDSVTSNKKRRFQKQWWTDELSREWNDLCVAEKNWRNKTGRRKSELKTIYVSARKHFDQSVQRTKRQFWFKMHFIIKHKKTSESILNLDSNIYRQ